MGNKFYHKDIDKLYEGFDGHIYYLNDDGDLSEPFETRRQAISDMNLPPWELDLGFMLEELSFWDEYYG
jgi:hypothetical protein